MKKLVSATLASFALFATTIAQAAESIEVAVAQLAEQYVSSGALSKEKSRRVAVTAFVMPDGRTTTFTNTLMIQLTGNMVDRSRDSISGEAAFSVIERAQLETALQNIDIEGVPIFDESTASKLGQFLGVDTLIVGEITPMRDRVRVDSRMIDIATMVTLEQANSWVPLTPSVKEQLDANIVMKSAFIQRDGGGDPRNGIWSGSAQCGDFTFNLAIAMVFESETSFEAMQTYYPNASSPNGTPPGALKMSGTVDAASGEMRLAATQWLHRPQGHSSFPIKGAMDADRGSFAGAFESENCAINKVTLSKS